MFKKKLLDRSPSNAHHDVLVIGNEQWEGNTVQSCDTEIHSLKFYNFHHKSSFSDTKEDLTAKAMNCAC